jgi:NTE family protein
MLFVVTAGRHDKFLHIASEEGARRHYSVKYLLLAGMLKNGFSAPILRPDYKILDPDEKWYYFNNDELRKTILEHVEFPIPSNDNGNEEEEEQDDTPPRLLVTSVDIAEGAVVIFDSFKKDDGSRKSMYRKEEIIDGRKFWVY